MKKVEVFVSQPNFFDYLCSLASAGVDLDTETEMGSKALDPESGAWGWFITIPDTPETRKLFSKDEKTFRLAY